MADLSVRVYVYVWLLLLLFVAPQRHFHARVKYSLVFRFVPFDIEMPWKLR